nr:AtzE family amidohydrolase [Thiomonas sp. FB-Cd]
MASVLDVSHAVAGAEISASKLIEEAIARLDVLDAGIRAFTHKTTDRARAQAARIDRLRAQGHALPPLAGVPYAVKNLFDIEGLPTLAGSRLLAGAAPAKGDAALVQRMDAAGAVLLGALNMDEFAYGFTTENTHYGATCNPHDLTRSAGGSSGGSAAAVASGMVPLALGSDTNGSIRVPASLCGIFGIKPTFGRLPREGSYPFVYSLDHLGAFARSAEDLALCYSMLCRDARDEAEAIGSAITAGPDDKPLRVAWLGGYFERNAGPEAKRAARAAAQALGAQDELELPGVEAARAAAFVITAAEGGQLHIEHLRENYEQMEPLSRDRLAAGAMVPAAWYTKAQRVRARFHAQVCRLFEEFDLFIAPATPVPAQPLGSAFFDLNGCALATRPNMGLLTQPISCIGLPVVAVPMRVAPEALPIGVQLIAPPWREDIALRAALQLERCGAAQCKPLATALQARTGYIE